MKESREAFERAYALALKERSLGEMAEAVIGLLRCACESLDHDAIKKWDAVLDRWMTRSPRKIPPRVWYAKGLVAFHEERWSTAQRQFHRYMKTVRAAFRSSRDANRERDRFLALGFLMLAWVHSKKHRALRRARRSEWMVRRVLDRFGDQTLPEVNGMAHWILARICERRGDLGQTHVHLQTAHAAFLEEHHWYLDLYVLLSQARLARLSQNLPMARWHLDLLKKATSGPDCGRLKQEILREEKRLLESAVDLIIDSQKGVVLTRDRGEISLRKQYVLLDLLQALSKRHSEELASGAYSETDEPSGMSKAEIIQAVWHETYRPEAHDNKLYYNINRLRKLIEPDMRVPRYLLSCKTGYRLAPGLRVKIRDRLGRVTE